MHIKATHLTSFGLRAFLVLNPLLTKKEARNSIKTAFRHIWLELGCCLATNFQLLASFLTALNIIFHLNISFLLNLKAVLNSFSNESEAKNSLNLL